MNKIEFKNVSFAYKKKKVINELNFKVRKGEIHGLLGHNGAGKTTVLRLITGLMSPLTGNILVDSKSNIKNKVFDCISYMPETLGIYEKLTAMQNLHFRGVAEGLSIIEIKKRAAILLAKLKLDFKKDELTGYWSNGLKKRLSLACAIIQEPKLLLLDEPTNSIDPASLKIIIDILKDLNQNGTTIVVCSHDLASISKLCSTVTIIQNGEAIYSNNVVDLSSLEKSYLKITEE